MKVDRRFRSDWHEKAEYVTWTRLETGMNMAFYVKAEKRAETPDWAFYEYWSREDLRGTLQLSKDSREVTQISGIIGDERNDLFMRAAVKLRREWKEGRIPAVIEWAS